MLKSCSSYLIIILCWFTFSGCSDSISDLRKDDVSVTINNSDLRIKNNSNHSIYYFAVRSGPAPVQFAPISTDKNRVRPGRVKKIPLDSIHIYEPGNEILFYYWSQKEPKNNNIKFKNIQIQ